MKIKILKENEEKTVTQRRKPRFPLEEPSVERTLDDFEDFDSFGDPAELEPLDNDDLQGGEDQLDPKMMMMIKKAVEQELRNPAILKAIAQLIKVR